METAAVVVPFTMVNDGAWAAGMVMVLEVTGASGAPSGVVPRTAAVLMIEPVSRSACVTVWVPVQMVDAPGVKVVSGQVIPVALGSFTTMAFMVTLPRFFTVKL